MPACVRNAEIEGTAAVAERGPPAPPAARSTRIWVAPLSGHQHQAEIGDRVSFILLRRTQKKETGAAVISGTTKAMKTHKSKIKQTGRMPGTGCLMVIGASGDKILPNTSTGMEHCTIIIRCCNMTGIGGPAHQVSATKQGVAASV